MRALVVYESMYGNTHVVAGHIADGLRTLFEVDVVPVVQATPDRVAAADFVVVGGPTHAHSMSRRSTRQAAAEAAAKPGSDLHLEADAIGPGLREWFAGAGKHPGVRAAAFDTRIEMPAAITGRAGRGIARHLRRSGFQVVAEPESFFVDKHNHLTDGQEERATAWGTTLAHRVCAAST
jgi:flavodoxin